jgi:spore maturation protein CgeB
MRVAVVGADDNGSLALCFVRGARESGHDARAIFADRLVAGWRPLFLARRLGIDAVAARPLTRALERRVATAEPEIVLVVKGRFIDARCIERLRRSLRCPILNYYPDHPLWPGHDDLQVIEALRVYDEVLIWGDHVATELRERDVRARVVPFGYDPATYAPPASRPSRVHDIVMVGQRYIEREAFVRALADLRVFVSGVGWDAALTPQVRAVAGTQRYSGTEICQLYWSSALALNSLAPWNVPAHNMRTFEIPATGTPMIATRTPEHERIFGEDGAVLVSDPDEARSRVLKLLEDEEALRRIGDRGRMCVAGHTYAARMAELLKPWIAAPPELTQPTGSVHSTRTSRFEPT